MINVKVEKQGTENTATLIRRFTKRVQGSGVLRRARSVRYYGRPISKLLRKQRTIKGIDRAEKRAELIKLGKITDQKIRKRRR